MPGPGPTDAAGRRVGAARTGRRRAVAVAVCVAAALVAGVASDAVQPEGSAGGLAGGAEGDAWAGCLPSGALPRRGVPLDPAGVRSRVDREAVRPVAALLAVRDALVGSSAGAAGTALTATAADVVDRLAAVPLTAWRSEVVAVAEPPRGDAGSDEERWTEVRVRVRHRLVGDLRDTVRDRVVTAVERNGCWQLAADVPDPAGGVPDLWDLGPVRVVRVGAVVLVGSGALPEPLLRSAAEEAADGARVVDNVWGTDWRRTTVVLAPASLDEVAALTRQPRGEVGQFAATAFQPSPEHGSDGSPFGEQRVVVNPETLTALTPESRRLVLAHELTHVATVPDAPTTPPLWLQECYADAVGIVAAGYGNAEVLGLVAAELEDAELRRLPRSLPDATGFDAALGQVAAAYALSDAACLALVDGDLPGSTDELTAVYRTAAGRPRLPSPASSGVQVLLAGAPWPFLPSGAPAPSDAAPGKGPGAGSADGSAGGSGDGAGGTLDPNAADAAALRAALGEVATDEAGLVRAWHGLIADLVDLPE